jgi:hypothetical protein
MLGSTGVKHFRVVATATHLVLAQNRAFENQLRVARYAREGFTDREHAPERRAGTAPFSVYLRSEIQAVRSALFDAIISTPVKCPEQRKVEIK